MIGNGGETKPLAYIDNNGAAVYVEDVLFFLEKFNRLGRPIGCHINFDKTHIITSNNGTSPKYGTVVADSIELALDTFFIFTYIVDGMPPSTQNVPSPHTALCHFAQYTLHKLPHLLSSKVMYCLSETKYEWWNDWVGSLLV